MTEVTIDATTIDDFHSKKAVGGIVWTSDSGGGVGYEIYRDSNDDLVYRKTTDGAATWSSTTVIDASTGAAGTLITYYEKETAGTGTKIHIFYINKDTEDLEYRYLDTSDDSIGAAVQVVAGTTVDIDRDYTHQSIWGGVTRGGNIVGGGWLDNDGEHGAAKSTNGGTSFSAITDPADGAGADQMIFSPGNEDDDNDFWLLKRDESENALELEVYDDTGNSWTQPALTVSGTFSMDKRYFNMDAVWRHSDKALLYVIINAFDISTADMLSGTITGNAGSGYTHTAGAEVFTNTVEAVTCCLFINQQNNDVYAAYQHGTSFGSSTGVRPKMHKSDDDMATWGSAVVQNTSGEADLRGVWLGHSVGDDGGRVCVSWHQNDFNDIMCSGTEESVAIAAVAAGANPKGPLGHPFHGPLAGPVGDS